MRKYKDARKEWDEYKEEYKYMIYTCFKDDETYFKIEDINPDCLTWGYFLCNFTCFHKSIEDCIENVSGTLRPIIYNGKNINPIKEDVFLCYNPYTGEVYRNYIY